MGRYSRHHQSKKRSQHCKEKELASEHGHSTDNGIGTMCSESPLKQRKTCHVTDVSGSLNLQKKHLNIKDRVPLIDDSENETNGTVTSNVRSDQVMHTDFAVPVSLVRVHPDQLKLNESIPSNAVISSGAACLIETEPVLSDHNTIVQSHFHPLSKNPNSESKPMTDESSDNGEHIDSQSSENERTAKVDSYTCIENRQHTKTIPQTDILMKPESNTHKPGNKNETCNVSSTDLVIKVEPVGEYKAMENSSSPQTFQEKYTNDSSRIIFHGHSKRTSTVVALESESCSPNSGKQKILVKTKKLFPSASQSSEEQQQFNVHTASATKANELYPFGAQDQETSSISLPSGLNFPLKVEPADEELDFSERSVDFGNEDDYTEGEALDPSTRGAGFDSSTDHIPSGTNRDMLPHVGLGNFDYDISEYIFNL